MRSIRAIGCCLEKVDFNFEIRPLLSDRCFKCHGPDDRSRMAKLRLDSRESALRVIKPGDAAGSEVLRRLTSSDPAVRMPPPWSNLAVTQDEIALIRRWVEAGAEYRPHWSFIPVAAAQAPAVKERDWPRSGIDNFVLARLEREGLRPQPEAARETLIRRLSLDLTGLPPSLDEIDAFLGDRASGAYERVVDRLLASPRYGERMAGCWLDLARYADTYGYQADVDRDMSPWRDWVIGAFNRNLPWDRFIVEQIAGDLVPGATRDQRLATAFNRLHRQTNEGGSIEEEFRVEYVADRVHTMGTAFLGLTLECSRCHDHKYDPVSQRDYYRLFAFFNNIDESGLYSHFTRATPSPALLLYEDGVEVRHRELRAKLAEAERALARLRASARGRFEEWLRGSALDLALPQPVAAFAFDQADSNKTPNSAAAERPGELVDAPELVDGRRGKALRFSGDNAVVCKGSGAFGRTNSFSFSLWLRPAESQARAVVFHRSRAWTDSGSRGYELVLENGRPAFSLIHFWPGNALSVRARDALPLDEWSHLTVTYDGSSRAAGLRLYRNGRPMAAEIVRDNLYKEIVHRKEWGDMESGKVELMLGARFRDAGFKGGRIDEFRVFDRSLTPLEVEAEAAGAKQVRASAGEELLTYYLNRHDPEYRAALAALDRLRRAESSLIDDVREIMVMQDVAEPRETHLLKRGAYDAPAERVEPGTPDQIMPFPPDLPRNRLGLARWIVDPRNPLTARVAVNQVWKLHFGRGLVATPENFGSQGQLPTHPDLLDWLAHRFVASGWDRKALHRLIVLSATYRQSSEAGPELRARDPENRLLARGPRHRLSAEQIRDSALAASGLLASRIGGPSVKPYQPAGLWEESGTNKTYAADKGEGLYRRSLYTFWRRTSPPPSMLAFDAPSREVCTARREATQTPLQALVLLNDPQFVEAARVLAERLARGGRPNLDGRIEGAFRLLLARRPDERERDVLRRLYSEQLAYFTEHPEAAERYLAVGEHARAGALGAADVAATAVLVSALMNQGEFVMKR
ncbi:MAG: hypothetical protein DMG07_13190 [Acidobacteria bacterium]|nr:MAG: hypothetical protein DMG07_13190 [Acidobacteriota bacterium]